MGWRNPLSNSDQPINPEYEQEARLVEQARSGSERAFAALLARYQQPVFRLIFYLVGSETEARELAKAALKHALLHMPRVPAGYSIRPWILRVATLVAIDAVRARIETPQQIIAAQLLPPADAPRMVDADPQSRGIVQTPALRPSQPLAKRAADPGMTIATSWSEIPLDLEQQLVRHLLAGLPDGDAELLALGVVGQVATRDLAALAGTSQRSIRRRIARALIMFQSQYQNVWQSVLPPGTPPPRVISSDATLLASGIHNRPATPPATSEVAISQVAQDRLEALRMQDAPTVVLRTSQPLPDVSTSTGALVRAALEQPDAPAFGTMDPALEELTDAVSDPAEESGVTDAVTESPSNKELSPLSTSTADSSISKAGTRILPRFGPPLAASLPVPQQPEWAPPAVPASGHTDEGVIRVETSDVSRWGESAVLAIPHAAESPQASEGATDALAMSGDAAINDPSPTTAYDSANPIPVADPVDEAQPVSLDQLGVEFQALVASPASPAHSESGLRFMDTAALAEQSETTVAMDELPALEHAGAEHAAAATFPVGEMPDDVDQMGETFLATLFTAEASSSPPTPGIATPQASDSTITQSEAHSPVLEEATLPTMSSEFPDASAESNWSTTTSLHHTDWISEAPETTSADSLEHIAHAVSPNADGPHAGDADAAIVDEQPEDTLLVKDAAPLSPLDNQGIAVAEKGFEVEDPSSDQANDLAETPPTNEHEVLMWAEASESASDRHPSSESAEVATQANLTSDAIYHNASTEQNEFAETVVPSGDEVIPTRATSIPDTMPVEAPEDEPAPTMPLTSQGQFSEPPLQPLIRSGDTIVVSSQARSDYMARHRPTEVDASDLAGFPGVDFALAQPTAYESPLPAPPPTVTLVRGGREDRPMPADDVGPDAQTPDMADLGGIVESVASPPPPGNVTPTTGAQPALPKPRTPTRPMPRLRKDVDEPPGIW